MKNIDDLKLIVLDNCKEFGQKVDKHLQKIRKNKKYIYKNRYRR